MKRVRIYTTPFCGYCRAAKELLLERDIPYEEIDVTFDKTKRAWLAKVTGQTTVPQVFFGDESIGGFQELSEIDRDEDLRARVGL